MKRAIKILDAGFSLLGYNIFYADLSAIQTLSYQIRRSFLLGCDTLLVLVFLWNIITVTFDEIGDKVFLINVTCVYTITLAQTIIFAVWRKEIAQIFREIVDVMENGSQHKILNEYSEGLFERCKKLILYASQVSAVLAVANMSMIVLTPLKTAKYIFPAEFPFVRDKKVNFVINFALQGVSSLYVGVFFGFFSLIFIIFTIAILYDLKLVAEVCGVSGESDQNRDIRIVTAESDNISLTSLTSPQLLRLIHEIHLKAIIMVQDINKIFSISILLWEVFMVIGACMLYVLSLIDPARIFSFAPACGIVIAQYLIVSLLSTLVKDALHDVGMRLYTSQWHFMAIQDRKSMMMILAMAQQSKTLTVWSFADASLERFTDVSSK